MPTLIYEYNQSMTGCDRLDQLVRCYNNFGQTTVKWLEKDLTWTIEVCHVQKQPLENVIQN